MNVNLTPNITGKNVNIIKGATQADLTNSVNNSKTYRDEAEAFSIVSEAKSVEASYSALNASISSTNASDKATIATTKANEASNSANSASASETVCIAKATIATDNADIAIAQATIATNKATEANTSANIANTQANIAITKASEASISAINALASENNADTSEANALIYRNQAESFANSINPSDLVHISGTETITGNKTFSGTVSGLTKATVGLSNVDNTSDANKPISNAVQTALNSKADKATTLGGYGITDAYTKTSTDSLIDIHSKTAKTTLADADEFMTADSTSSWSLKKITWASIKTLLANLFIPKVTSTDNAIVRFNGTTGEVQNSGVIIDDNGNVKANSFIAVGETKTHYISTDSNIGGTNAFRITRYANSGAFEAVPFMIGASGNVGIGVTPSAWIGNKALQIGMIGIQNDLGTNVGSFMNNTYYDGANHRYIQSLTATRYSQYDGTHRWYTAPSGTAGNAITWTNAMTLDANGKLIFGSNVFSARMSFTGDYATYGDAHITMKNNPTTNYGNVVFLNAAGTQVGYIQASSTATAYITSSDYRLKDDIKPMLGSIERLMELKPCNFVWKETGHRVDGFIAHEVHEVVPEAATGVKDEMMEEKYEISPRVEATYDEEGNELTPVVEAVVGKREVPKYQGIDQSKLVPLLTSALQDAILKIELLENRIIILESK